MRRTGIPAPAKCSTSSSRVTTKAQPFVPVDLGQVAREVVSDLEATIERAGARPEDVEIGELPVIEADPTQMRQLLRLRLCEVSQFCQGAGALSDIVPKSGHDGPQAVLSL